MSIYYVYAYLRGKDSVTAKAGTPYYVGKGKNKRAWAKHHGKITPKEKSRIVILESNLTEIGAFALERRLIRWYGRKNNKSGILLNLTDGGEGQSGWIPSIATKEKMSKSRLGIKLPPRFPVSDETRKKLSLSKLGKKRKPFSIETRAKMSLASKGKPKSDEHRQKLLANLGLR